MATGSRGLDLSALENWLWEAACAIRGPVDAPKFKDYILPLVFLKRLSDVFDDEIERLVKEYGSEEMAMYLIEEERRRGTIAQGKGIVRFYIPPQARWNAIRTRTTGLGEYLTDAGAGRGPGEPEAPRGHRPGGFQRHRRRPAHRAR